MRTSDVSHPGSGSGIWYVSNAGPVKFYENSEGKQVPRQSAGGMVVLRKAVLAADALQGRTQRWVCAAETPGDYEVGGYNWNPTALPDSEVLPVNVEMLRIPPAQRAAYKGQFSDRVLWMTLHGMPHNMTETQIRASWEHYVNTQYEFANHVVANAATGDTVVVDDFQLWMVPLILSEKRPDLKVTFYLHVPVCTPKEMKYDPVAKRGIPDDIAAEILASTAKGVRLGCHSPVWAENYVACRDAYLEVPPDPALRPYVIPGFMDVPGVRESAHSDVANQLMLSLTGDLGFASLKAWRANVARPRQTRSPLIGFVGRVDPKNGLEELLEWYLQHLNDDKYPTKYSIAVVGDRSRAGSKEYDDLWERITAPETGLIARINAHPKALLVNFLSNPPGAAHAVHRMCDVGAVPSLRGGRDLVAIEPIAKRDATEPPVTVVVSDKASASETLAPPGRPGAILITGLDPTKPMDDAVASIDAAMHRAYRMSPTQVERMHEIGRQQVALENPVAYASVVEARAHGRPVASGEHSHNGGPAVLTIS